ncbi:histone-lysine N-methyltransferase [Tylopilus felleus]
MADRMWEPSPSPVESWSDAEGANENGEWPIRAIVGEEIRLDDTSRYEVRWDNWHRSNGSNTTWETEGTFEKIKLIQQWKKNQKRIRNSLAEHSCDMNVPWPDDAVHKRLTDQCKQAYAEKLEKRRREGPRSTADWDQEIEKAYGNLQEPERGELNSKLRVRRGNPPSASGSSSTVVSTPSHSNKRSSPSFTVSPRDQPISAGPPLKRGRRGRPLINSTPSSPRSATTTTPTLSRRGTRLALTPSSAGSSSKEPEITQNPLPSVIISQPTLRGRISSTWNKAAREAMAAMVRISPDISDEDFPRNLRKFKYVEKGYVFGDEALKDIFNASRGVFTSCDCFTCSNTSRCTCRDLSEIYDLRGKTNFSAYSEGSFTFDVPRGVDVIECNKYCPCDNDCGNRVVQRPRDVGIEIFDTRRCGWGVRALEDIPRGKVLGTYAGMLVRRDEVDELPEEHQGYLFDLDSTEVRNSENFGEKYTVDSYECGNWTRFVNHSCSPNMQVYCVVYDTIPYVNMPYVAFVASIDILAGTELTIDYCPYAEIDRKGKRPAKGGDCRCESVVCRGWIKV